MTLPSRRFNLWQRMYARFSLEPAPAQMTEPPGVATVIVPVTDADELLADPGIQFEFSITVGAGVSANTIMLTVPAGKRWKLYTLLCNRTSGDNLCDGFALGDVSVGDIITIDIQTAAVDVVLRLPVPLTLEENDTIRFHTDGSGVSGSDFNTRAWITEEDRF